MQYARARCRCPTSAVYVLQIACVAILESLHLLCSLVHLNLVVVMPAQVGQKADNDTSRMHLCNRREGIKRGSRCTFHRRECMLTLVRLGNQYRLLDSPLNNSVTTFGKYVSRREEENRDVQVAADMTGY